MCDYVGAQGFAMSGLLGSRFETERERLNLSRADIAARAAVSAEQIRRVEKDESKPGADILSALARSGGDVLFVLTGARNLIDAQRLAFITHAIEAAAMEQLGCSGHVNPRVLGLIYNQVLSRGRSSDDDVELAKAEVATYLEGLRAADIAEDELAKRLLRIDTASPELGSAARVIKFKGNHNQVAGRDFQAAPKQKK